MMASLGFFRAAGFARAERFVSIPGIELLDDGRRVRVIRAFCFVREGPLDDEAKREVCVPEGFVSNGASIPKILWPVAGGPFEGKHRSGAILHDYLYSLGREGPSRFTRAEADRVFYEAMRSSGVRAYSAWIKYVVVRLVGRW